ncbi:hypothetical protein GRX03_01365 [Halovenus sp. WSH3]|uniref:Uncharacterized protein n=1 Tax=Halovenus carboxidivorans TaxID=2692199 RepID=A0A6B0T5V2_9EURY|nr:hypothetical protein [Halovenus carboxidivorans]MXR50260.1 hypothetical protein [Halovenus carboxidivorans]
MQRRRILVAAGAALTTGLAGCSGGDEEPDRRPEPAASELQISVTNDDSRAHSVRFVLDTTREDLTVITGFDAGEIDPGTTWTRESADLEPGSYDLTVDMSTLNTESTLSWIGHECPIKAVEITLRTDGFRIRDRCPDERS